MKRQPLGLRPLVAIGIAAYLAFIATGFLFQMIWSIDPWLLAALGFGGVSAL